MQELLQSIKNTISYIHHNNNNSIHIGYGIDDNYARCTGTSIASFCINNPNKYFSFHILCSNLSLTNKKNFSLLAERFSINIKIYELNTLFLESLNLPTKLYLPLSTYFRFILPLILKNYNKIFYIDADIICLSHCEELFDISLNNNIIAAIPDVNWLQKQRIKDLKLSNHNYFNAGVLIIDVKKWNNFNIINKMLKQLSSNSSKFKYLDQDILNILLTQKIYYLPQIYNCIDLTTINHKDIVLLHFAANPKPWNICWSLSPNCNEFNKNLYQYYENQTPWSGLPPTLPRNYKEMEFYAKCLRKHKYYIKSFHWYLKYLLAKIKYLIKKY